MKRLRREDEERGANSAPLCGGIVGGTTRPSWRGETTVEGNDGDSPEVLAQDRYFSPQKVGGARTVKHDARLHDG